MAFVERARRGGPAASLCGIAMTLLAGACESDPAAGETGGGGGDSASTSGSAGGGGQSDGGNAAGGGPLACNETVSTVPVGECDLLQQNCPEGMGCEPVPAVGGYETACVSRAGLKGAKVECSEHDECQAGLVCQFGFCSPPCCPESNEPCAGGTCNSILEWGSYYVSYCSFLPTCEIFTADVCAAGEDCHILNGYGYAVCVQSDSMVKGEGEPCEFLNQCGEMQTCFPPGASGSVCRYHCALAAVDEPPGLGGCPSGLTCENLDVGLDGVGVCLP